MADAPLLRLDEAARLYALHGYQVLDTPAEPRFDLITRLLSRTLEVPIALISLVDAERQWFKSRHGLEAASTQREVAFCAHTILGNDALVVEDAREDPRFAHNPLVLGSPHIRFYAGAPLISPHGHRLGTLCAIDQKPRSLDAEQRALLKELSEHVMDLFELRRLGTLERDMDEATQALAHDLRPGLHQIRTFGELIATEPENRLSPKSLRHLTLIQEVSERTRARLDAIHTFLRASDNCEVAPISTSSLLLSIVSKLTPSIQARAAEVKLGPLFPVLGRRSQLELLFTHLLDNALKYAGPGPIKISVQAALAAERVQFELKDNGPGIPDAQRGRALRLFQRLHSGAIPGNGAGLALCRKIVEASGGRLSIDGAPEGGAIIRFSLPRANLD